MLKEGGVDSRMFQDVVGVNRLMELGKGAVENKVLARLDQGRGIKG